MSQEYPHVALEKLKAPGRYSMVGGPFGSKLVSRDYVPEGIPVIRGTNLPLHSRFSFDDLVFVTERKVATDLFGNLAFPGDVIVTQRGTLGQVGLIPSPSPYPRFVVSQSQMKLTVDRSKADPLFVYYGLKSPIGQHEIHSRALTAGVPHINLSLFQQIRIPLPPLPTQQKIIAVLSAYDDLIENNSRRIKALEEMAQRIYREWFIDFRYPGHESIPILDSALGPIPVGWSVGRWGQYATLDYGRALRGYKENTGQYPVFGTNGQIGWYNEALFPPGVVVGRKGAYRGIRLSREPCWVIDTAFYLRLNNNLPIDSMYAYHQLRTVDLDEIDSGSAIPSTSRDAFYAIPVIIPPTKLMRRFSAFAGDLDRCQRVLTKDADNLRATRDLLLPRLISGEIDVSDLDIAMPEVAA